VPDVWALYAEPRTLSRRADHDRRDADIPPYASWWPSLTLLDAFRLGWEAQDGGGGVTTSPGPLPQQLQGAFQDFVLASSDSFHSEVRGSRQGRRTTLLDVYRRAMRAPDRSPDDGLSRPDRDGRVASFDDMARAYIAAHPSRHPQCVVRRRLGTFSNRRSSTARRPRPKWRVSNWELGAAWDAPDMTLYRLRRHNALR